MIYIKKNNHIISVINNVTYIDDILIVNKTYSLPPTYKPTDSSNIYNLNQITLNNFFKMQKEAHKDNIDLYISSGYRSYQRQEKIYNNYRKKDPANKVDTYSARPGHSEHQTGLAFDVNTIDDTFASTKESKWLNNNCYKYGFIIRYPKGKENITGYKYEPWHLRYVGTDLALILYNEGQWLTLEEYFEIPSQYT